MRRFVLVKLDGRCGNCEVRLSLDWSYCPFCGAHWTVLEPTMTVRPLSEVFARPRKP